MYSIVATQSTTDETRLYEIVKTVQTFIEHCFVDSENFFDADFKEKIVINMFLVLELLYEHFNEESECLAEVTENSLESLNY